MTPREAINFLHQMAVNNPKQPLLWASVQCLVKHITTLEQKLSGNPIEAPIDEPGAQTEEEESDDDSSGSLG